jgi:YVTN family beta-propeller protein
MGYKVAITPDGSKAYAGGYEYSPYVAVFDLGTKQHVTNINVGGYPYNTVFTPDGSKAYVTNRDSGGVHVINTSTYTVVKTIDAGYHPYNLAINKTGTRVYVTNKFGAPAVRVIDTSKDKVIETINLGVGTTAWDVKVRPDGRAVYVTVQRSTSGYLVKVNPATNTVQTTIPLGGYGISHLAVSPDSQYAYVTDTDGHVYIVNAVSMSVVNTISLDSPRYIAIG